MPPRELLTRLRWDHDTLWFDDKPRSCSRGALEALEEKLSGLLRASSWERSAVVEAGQALWSWLERDTRWLEAVKEARAAGRPWRLEVGGTPGALAHLPWEALHDGRDFLAAKLPAFMPVRRVDGVRGDLPEMEIPQGELAVLFMASAPLGQVELAYEQEEARILERCPSSAEVFLLVEESGTLDGLGQRLAELGDWSVVHFTCHGNHEPAPRLALETAQGDLDNADPMKVAETVNAHGGRVVVTSACLTAERAPKEEDSFVTALVRAGVPAAVGFAAKVPDGGATEFAAELYGRLVNVEALPEALAAVRRSRAGDGKADPRVWASARHIEAERVGALVLPRSEQEPRKIRARPDARAYMEARERHIPVAAATRFVGRRRKLQELIRAIEGKEHDGAVVLGLGGAGKSSLVGRALSRVKHRPVVLFRSLDRAAILPALRDRYGDGEVASMILSTEEMARAYGDEVAYERLLVRALKTREVRLNPAVFILDDAEARMVDDGARHGKQLDGEALIAVRGLLRALVEAREGRSRVVMTSRYDVAVPGRDGADLSAGLARIELGSMSATDARKLLKQADRYDERGAQRREPTALDEAVQKRCVEVAGHNPRLLVLLHMLLCEDLARGERALDEMKAYRDRERTTVSEEKIQEHLADLVTNDLIELSGARLELEAMTYFEVPVPLAAAARAIGCEAGVLERLLALSLLERDDDGLVMVPPLVAPHLRALTAEERQAIGRAFVEKALPEDWRADEKGGWTGPLERAKFLLRRCAELEPPERALGHAAGAFYLRRVVNAGLYGLAREETVHAERLGPHAMVSVHLAMAWATQEQKRADRFLGEAVERLMELDSYVQKVLVLKQRAAALVRDGRSDDAVTALTAADAAVPESDARLKAIVKGDIARILVTKGQVDDALKLHREELGVYEEIGDWRARAVTLGDIARILVTKGQADDALKFHRERQAIFEEIGDWRARAVTLGDIARILVTKGQVDDALKLHREELGVYEEIGDRSARAVTLGDIARILAARGSHDEALKLQHDRLEINKDLGNLEDIAAAQWDIARIHFARQEFPQALPLLVSSFQALMQIGRVDGIAAVGSRLAPFLVRMGHPETGHVEQIVLRAFQTLGRDEEAAKFRAVMDQARKKKGE